MTTKNKYINFLVEAFDENNELQNILIADRIGHFIILKIYFSTRNLFIIIKHLNLINVSIS